MMHPFEEALMGKAPFKLLDVQKESGKCKFCGLGLVYCYYIQSDDDKMFIVGATCVEKIYKHYVYRDSDPIYKKIREHKKEIGTKARHEREQKKVQEAKDFFEIHKETLQGLPHYYDWAAAKGETMVDAVKWNFAKGGTRAQMSMLGAMKHAMAKGCEE